VPRRLLLLDRVGLAHWYGRVAAARHWRRDSRFPVCTAGGLIPSGKSSRARIHQRRQRTKSPLGSRCRRRSLGSFCPDDGMNATRDCSAGFYCRTAGLSAPTGLCPGGYVCRSGTASPTTSECQPGFFCPPGSSAPIPCTTAVLESVQ
jgi:hypothetical protein